MIDHYQLLWFGMGIGFTVIAESLIWFCWRFFGAGSLRDYIFEEEEPDGNYRVIKKIKSPVQKIALVEQYGQFHVFANGSEMFSTTEDENKYAEAIIHVPMAVAQKRQRILIIGAGGGITAREALLYPEVNEITAVDFDATIMDFGKNLEPLVKFNKGSLNHPKVRTVIQDGRAFVENSSEKWDIIIQDLPEPASECPELSRLFSVEFYKILQEHLEPGGVITVACSSSSTMPDYFGAVQATLKAAGFYVLPYHFDFIVEFGSDWGFCLAATRPISPSDVQIKVSTRYMNQRRLKDMFYIPYYLSVDWDERDIQTDQNKLLLKIVEETWEN